MSSNSSNLKTQFLPQIPFLLQTPPTPPPFFSIFITILKEQQTRNTMFLYTITVCYFCSFFLVYRFMWVCLGQSFHRELSHHNTLFISSPTPPPPTPIVFCLFYSFAITLSFFFLNLFVFVLLFCLYLPHASFSLTFPSFLSSAAIPFSWFCLFASKIGSFCDLSICLF